MYVIVRGVSGCRPRPPVNSYVEDPTDQTNIYMYAHLSTAMMSLGRFLHFTNHSAAPRGNAETEPLVCTWYVLYTWKPMLHTYVRAIGVCVYVE